MNRYLIYDKDMNLGEANADSEREACYVYCVRNGLPLTFGDTLNAELITVPVGWSHV